MKFLPLGDDQQELPSRFERAQSLVTACLTWIDTAGDTMTKRVRILLENHLTRFVEHQRETSEPPHKPPHQTRRNDRLVEAVFVLFGVVMFGVVLLDGITDLTSVVQNGLSIGDDVSVLANVVATFHHVGHVQEPLGHLDQARSGKTLIRQDESWGSR